MAVLSLVKLLWILWILLILLILLILFNLFLILIMSREKKEENDFVIRFVVAKYKENVQWTCHLGHLGHLATLQNNESNESNKSNESNPPSFEIWTYHKGCPEDVKNENENFLDIVCDSELKIRRKLMCLPNVGRCDHTFLYYIINEYDRLPDLSIFLPASSMDEHKKQKALYIIQNAISSRDTVLHGFPSSFEHIKDFQLDEWVATNTENQRHNPQSKLLPASPRPMGKWFEHHIGLDRPIPVFTYYSIFAVHKRHILQHPKSYYENILTTVDHHHNPEAGHYIERSYSAIFWPYPQSCIYLT